MNAMTNPNLGESDGLAMPTVVRAPPNLPDLVRAAFTKARDAGDLTTIDDPSTLEQIKAALKS